MDKKAKAIAVEDMTAEQIETRKAEISAALDTADAAQMDAFEAEITALEQRRKALDTAAAETAAAEAAEAALKERRAAMAAVIGGAGTVLRTAPTVETRSQEQRLADIIGGEAYLNAYAKGIKSGDYRECRALLTKLATNGDVPVPTYISNRVETAWEKMTVLSRLRQTSFKGIATYTFELSAADAVVHEEGAAAPDEEALSLGQVSLLPGTVKKHISYSHEVEALTGRAYIDYLYNELEYRILKKTEDLAIAAILAAPATATATAASVSAVTVNAIDHNTIFKGLEKLVDSATRPVAIMNKQTYFTNFMGLEDLSGRPIYTVVTNNGTPSYFINGVEVIFNDQLTAGTQIIVGDLDGLVANLPNGYGVEFITDPYTLAPQDLVRVVGRMHVGVGVVRDKFFTKITVEAEGGGT